MIRHVKDASEEDWNASEKKVLRITQPTRKNGRSSVGIHTLPASLSMFVNELYAQLALHGNPAKVSSLHL